MFSFEGDFKTRPKVSLGGASRKVRAARVSAASGRAGPRGSAPHPRDRRRPAGCVSPAPRGWKREAEGGPTRAGLRGPGRRPAARVGFGRRRDAEGARPLRFTERDRGGRGRTQALLAEADSGCFLTLGLGCFLLQKVKRASSLVSVSGSEAEPPLPRPNLGPPPPGMVGRIIVLRVV